MTRFNFDSDTAGQPPKGFEFALTGKGKPGKWIVQAVDDAPSGKNVLAQTDGDETDYRFPIAYTGPELKDLRLSVKCKPIAGKGDQGCGIVWRAIGMRGSWSPATSTWRRKIATPMTRNCGVARRHRKLARRRLRRRLLLGRSQRPPLGPHDPRALVPAACPARRRHRATAWAGRNSWIDSEQATRRPCACSLRQRVGQRAYTIICPRDSG